MTTPEIPNEVPGGKDDNQTTSTGVPIERARILLVRLL